MSLDIVSYAMGKAAGGGGIIVPKTITANGTYNASDDSADGYDPVTVSVVESIDQWQIKMLSGVTLNNSYDYHSNSVAVTPLNNTLLFHIVGTFNNNQTVTWKWMVPKADFQSFVGKYLNFKMSGSISSYSRFCGLVQASVAPYAEQANVSNTTKKCLISPLPTESFAHVGIGVAINSTSGATVDAYIELTITDD